MNKCILVGNASNVLGKKLGSYIDSFENVVRINRFRIKGFESDLGIKCTHWVINYKLTTDERNYLVKNLEKVTSNTTDFYSIAKRLDIYRNVLNNIGVNPKSLLASN